MQCEVQPNPAKSVSAASEKSTKGKARSVDREGENYK